jgi:hypothetical protein
MWENLSWIKDWTAWTWNAEGSTKEWGSCWLLDIVISDSLRRTRFEWLKSLCFFFEAGLVGSNFGLIVLKRLADRCDFLLALLKVYWYWKDPRCTDLSGDSYSMFIDRVLTPNKETWSKLKTIAFSVLMHGSESTFVLVNPFSNECRYLYMETQGETVNMRQSIKPVGRSGIDEHCH